MEVVHYCTPVLLESCSDHVWPWWAIYSFVHTTGRPNLLRSCPPPREVDLQTLQQLCLPCTHGFSHPPASWCVNCDAIEWVSVPCFIPCPPPLLWNPFAFSLATVSGQASVSFISTLCLACTAHHTKLARRQKHGQAKSITALHLSDAYVMMIVGCF